MAYPGRHLRPAQVRPKSEAFLLEDLADKSLGGLKTREIRDVWFCEAIFLEEIRLFYMAYPGRHPRPAQGRPKSGQERPKSGSKVAKSGQRAIQERPKSFR